MPMLHPTLLHHNRLRQQSPLPRPQHIQRSRSPHPQSLRHRSNIRSRVIPIPRRRILVQKRSQTPAPSRPTINRRPQSRLPRRNVGKHRKPTLLHPQRPIRPRPIRTTPPHIPQITRVVVPIRPIPMQCNTRPIRIQIRGRPRCPAHRIHRQRRRRQTIAHRPPPLCKTPATASPTTRPTSAAEHTGFVRPAPATSVNTGADSPAAPPALLR